MILLSLLSATVIVSCKPQDKGLFGARRSGHEKYGDRIKEAGLDKTKLGSLWFFAAGKSIAQPLSVTLPYHETGYFAADEPSAAGLIFNARRGDRLMVTVSLVPENISLFFVELWQYAENAEDAKFLASADSTMRISHDIEKDGRYIVRLQPELLQGIQYDVTITTGPSLAFPVDASGNPKVISVWDDPRDGGVRSHEGVDIGAKFRTPAVAPADGYIRNVSVNRLGGNVVFMRPKGKNYTLYYAHLDTQIVRDGDEVKTGQVIGLVGNTGNAIHTPPHLHFGIYTSGGAVDPLPFIDRYRGEPAKLTANTSYLQKWVRASVNANVRAGANGKDSILFTIKDGDAVKVEGATGVWYKIRLPDGRQGYISSSLVTDKRLNQISADSLTKLFDHPSLLAASKKDVPEKSKLLGIGKFNEFFLVSYGNEMGWIAQDELQ